MEGRRTNVRFLMLFFLFIGVVINYLDRANISVTAPYMKTALHLSPVVMGLIFSAFSWSYAIMQIPGGLLLDRFGAKRSYGIALGLWSVFTLLQSFANGFAFLFGTRLGVGFAEAPTFPANNQIVTRWFPQKERAFAMGGFTAGEFVGLAFLSPFLFWLISTFSWRAVFVFTGVIGIIWAIFWFKLYHDPADSKKVNDAEMDYILKGGGLAENVGQDNRLTLSKVKLLLKNRQLIGISIGQFAVTTTLWFFLTWFPTYLETAKHMTILKVGLYSSIPYMAAFIGVLCGGLWSDWMLRRGVSVGVARKTPVITGLLLACIIVLANYTSSINLVIAILSVAFFAQGVSAISWTLVSEIAPPELMGLTGGLFNFAGNLSGIVTPIVIGFILNVTHSFTGALFFVGVVALIGAMSYIVIVGKVKRIEINTSNEGTSVLGGIAKS